MASSAGSLNFDLTLSVDQFTAGLAKAVGQATTKGQLVANALTGITSGMMKGLSAFTKGIASTVKDIAQVGMAYEDAFAKVQTIMAGVSISVDDMYNGILDASNKTGQAATDIAQSVYDAISGGVNEADALDFVEIANMLAVGGFTDTATAVNVLTTAMNAYGEKAKSASEISDILIKTQNLGKTTVAELGSSMGMVIPTAAALGVEVDQLGATYAILTANGIATAQATTSMNQMFSELSKSSSKAATILQKQTGKSFAQCMESGMNLGDVLKILYDSVDGDMTAFKNLWSSLDAGKAALSLAQTGSEEYNRVLGEMNDSAGTTQQAYETMTGTVSYGLKTIGNYMTNFKTGIYSKMQQPLGKFVNILSGKMERITSLWDGYADRILNAFSTGGIAGGIQEAINCFGEFQTQVQHWADELKDSDDPVEQSFGNVLQTVLDISSGISKAFDFFGTLFSEGLSAAVNKLELPTWDEMKEQVSTWWTNDIIPSMAFILNAVFGVAPEDTTAVLTTVGEWWSGAVGSVEAMLNAVMAIASGDTEKSKEAIQTWWNTTSSTFGDILKAAITLIGDDQAVTHVTEWWDGIKETVNGIIGVIFAIQGGDAEGAKQSIVQWWNGLFDSTSSLVSLVFGVEMPKWSDIEDGFNKWWNGGLYDGDKGVKQAFADSFKFMFGVDFTDFWSGVEDWWKEVQTQPWYQMLSWVTGFSDDRNAKPTDTWSYDWQSGGYINDRTGQWSMSDPTVEFGGAPDSLQEAIDSEDYDATVVLNPDYSNMPTSGGPKSSGAGSSFGGRHRRRGHATGLDYVPYDGYFATLHRGERVLTSLQNYNYSKNKNASENGQYVDNSTALHVDTMTISGDVDASVLATQISDLSRRRNRGYGY